MTQASGAARRRGQVRGIFDEEDVPLDEPRRCIDALAPIPREQQRALGRPNLYKATRNMVEQRVTEPVVGTARNDEGFTRVRSLVSKFMHADHRVTVDGDHDMQHGQGPSVGLPLHVFDGVRDRVKVDARVVGLKDELNTDDEPLLLGSAERREEQGTHERSKGHGEQSNPQ